MITGCLTVHGTPITSIIPPPSQFAVSQNRKERLLPVTRSRPDLSCLRNTTLFPMKRPASRISTVPGVIDDLQNRSDSNQIGRPEELERHECRVASRGRAVYLSLVGLALRVVGVRGLTSSAG
jgi:antitoxin (DNA-binding transcriptional repressor) of toxin-antitoxin stability system